MGRTRTRQKGSMNAAGTKKWDGTKWVPVNVARDGQRATRNGIPVVRRNGKWVPYKSTTRTTRRRRNGTRPTSTTTTTTTTPTKPLRTIPASERPKDMQAGKVYGDAGQPPAPTLPPKPTPTRSTPTKTRPTSTRTPQKKGEGGMDANYKAWAKANPALAKKVRKGQAGYKAINSSSSTPRAAGPENARDLRSGPTPPKRTSSAASAANAQNLRSGPTPPKRTALKTTAKPAEKKPAKKKPLTVPTNKIPKDLTGAAGRKYLADLDAGRLTRKRK